MNAEDPSSESCGRCARPVPSDQMTSTYAALQEELPSPPGSKLDDTTRNMASATQAWRCDQCGHWICNGCILPFVVKTRGRRMHHKGCGGVFKAPDAPSWIGVTGQRAVTPGSWKTRFGIETF